MLFIIRNLFMIYGQGLLEKGSRDTHIIYLERLLLFLLNREIDKQS